MQKNIDTTNGNFVGLLGDIKARIETSQSRAVFAVNTELLRLYWDIGRLIHERRQRDGRGAAVIPRLARELHNELPELKGFSERNIKRMLTFYREYTGSALTEKVPSVAAQLPEAVFWHVPWAHHIILMEKLKNITTRYWYMDQTLAHGWSRNILALQIDSQLHARQGKAVTNFAQSLPSPQSDLVRQTLKDPYIFDFLTLEEPFHERELEASLVRHLENFLLELGQGFAFLGRQYHLSFQHQDYYIDLLFYHLKLRAFIVIELKKGDFKPEHAGKLNFYCNVVNELLRHPDDQPTIGLILCQSKDNLVAEYSLSGIDKPIGVSTYQLTRALPEHFSSALPTVEEIEHELAYAARENGNE